MPLLFPYLFWHSILGRRGTTLHTGRWCTCNRWWGCNQDHSRTPPPSRGCSARKAAGGRCSLHDSPLEVVDKLGQGNKEKRRKTLTPAPHCRVASVCQNTQGTLQAPFRGHGSFGVHLSGTRPLLGDHQRMDVHTSRGATRVGLGDFQLSPTPASSAVTSLFKSLGDGIWEDSQLLGEGERKIKGETYAYMGMERDSQNKDNPYPYEASQIHL